MPSYFADTPKLDFRFQKPWILQQKQIAQNIIDTVPTEFINPFRFQNDPCNISIAYDPPEGARNWGDWKLPKISLNIRNKYCQPPPPPVKKSKFDVGGICNCSIRIIFAFYRKEQKLFGGAGIGLCLLNGEACPSNLRNATPSGGSSSVDNARGYFEPYNEQIFSIRFATPYTVDERNLSTGDGITLIYTSLVFTTSQVASGNGIVDPQFPRFIKRDSNGEESLIDAPWEIVATSCVGCKPNEYIDPPPPPPPKECECMCCCDNDRNNDALLRLILKRIGGLPASVPDNFTKQQPTYISIESLAELMLWQAKQLDALNGNYPIEIQLEDSDLTQEGNQEQKIVIPNQAEALAELLGLSLTTKRDTHATLVTAIKALSETGMTKQVAIKGLDVGLANAEFLGYKLDQQKKTIPMSFTPGGKNLAEVLKEKTIEIISYVNNDKVDLQDDLKKLLTMAARWNAQNWRKVTGDAAKTLKGILVDTPKKLKDTQLKKSQDDFNTFTEKVERGFIDITGISDADDPWGEPYANRPKIREIGTENGRYDKDGREKPKPPST